MISLKNKFQYLEMNLTVAIQELKLDNKDFQKPQNFEISLCIIYNGKLVNKLDNCFENISVPPF